MYTIIVTHMYTCGTHWHDTKYIPYIYICTVLMHVRMYVAVYYMGQ